MKQLGLALAAVVLAGCARQPVRTAEVAAEPAAESAVRSSSLLAGPTGWHPVDPGDDDPHCLVRFEPDDPNLQGAVLMLTAWDVPGLDDVVLARDCEQRLKTDLPQRWGSAGYALNGSQTTQADGEEFVVFDSQLGGALGTLVGKQFCTYRGTTQYVLSGWAPKPLFGQIEPVLEAAAKSLKLSSGAES